MPDSPATDFASEKHLAMEALGLDRPKDAFHLLKPFLRHEYEFKSEAQFLEAFGSFAKIARALAGDQLSDQILAVVNDHRDVERLYTLGHSLIEHGLPGVAATILKVANAVHPEIPGVISELATAFEQDGNTRAAVELLEETPKLRDENFLLGYLHGFNSLLSGDLDRSRESLDKLKPDNDDSHQKHMVHTLGAMHRRANEITDATWLDKTDLRGWHYVINGGLLAHLSPHGFPDPMNGRYAFLNDTNENCVGGIELLRHVIQKKLDMPKTSFECERVFSLPDRNSEILAHIAARILDVPVETYTENERRPGVLVSYDGSSLQGDLMNQTRNHVAGQILFVHAMNWTEMSPITGDVTSLLYQTIISPWQPGIVMDEDDNMQETPADERRPEVIADEVCQLRTSEEFGKITNQEQLDRLIDLIELPRSGGSRCVMWENSPVSSSRFQ